VTEVVSIEAIGHRGDGIVSTPDGPLYVPFTLPGERVAIERRGDRGRLVEVVAPSPDRTAPICRHFGRCGGCALQMTPLEATRKLKRGFVVAALRQRGVSADVEDTLAVATAGRRRVTLTACKAGARTLLGFHERLSDRLVDIEECPVLLPALAGRLDGIRAVIARLTRKRAARLAVLLTASGLDINISGVPAPTPRDLARIAKDASAAGIARLSVDGAPILTLAAPVVSIGDATVIPPPGAFLQASAEAEAAMARLVTSHVAGAASVVDLFAGIGTFTLRPAADARVLAVEASEEALQSLTDAARRTSGLKPVTTERRDLFAFPLKPQELGRFDAAIIDPPYAGAKAQAAALAASRVKTIASISCNPATFARDARTLIDGGYRLTRVVPVDQFVYSAEVEVVGLFSRG